MNLWNGRHLCFPAALLLVGTSCITFEGTARSALEAKDCADIVFTRTGAQSFDYTAICEQKFCEGSITTGGSSTNSAQTCLSVPPPGTSLDEPGEAVLGLGNVTGLCRAQDIAPKLQEALPRFEACYDLGLRSHPEMQGTQRFTWTIDSEGKATVSRADSPLATVHCGEGIVAQLAWPPPEHGTCTASWTVGYHKGEPPDDLGHDRLPAASSCPNPISLEPAPGEEVYAPTELAAAASGEWDLSAIEVWTVSRLGKTSALHARADGFGTSSPPEGAVDGRQTALCHTQALQWTVTTTTDADGEKVETRELAGADSIRQNGSGTFPVFLSLDEDHARGLRRFEFKLENGVFVSSVRDTPLAGETPTIASIFESGDAKLDLTAVRRSPDRLDLVLGLQEPNFEVFATGQYDRRE